MDPAFGHVALVAYEHFKKLKSEQEEQCVRVPAAAGNFAPPCRRCARAPASRSRGSEVADPRVPSLVQFEVVQAAISVGWPEQRPTAGSAGKLLLLMPSNRGHRQGLVLSKTDCCVIIVKEEPNEGTTRTRYSLSLPSQRRPQPGDGGGGGSPPPPPPAPPAP
eukprot:SAG22_NODE_2335_length_2702_cov_10.861698_6_plen_162_part_01